MSGIGASARTQRPVRVRPRSVQLPATSTPECSICAIAGAVPIMMSAVSPFSRRLRTPPIVPKVNSTWSPVSRVNLGAKPVTTYFTAPADRTFSRTAGRAALAAGVIVRSSLRASAVHDIERGSETCLCTRDCCVKRWPTVSAGCCNRASRQPGAAPERFEVSGEMSIRVRPLFDMYRAHAACRRQLVPQ